MTTAPADVPAQMSPAEPASPQPAAPPQPTAPEPTVAKPSEPAPKPAVPTVTKSSEPASKPAASAAVAEPTVSEPTTVPSQLAPSTPSDKQPSEEQPSTERPSEVQPTTEADLAATVMEARTDPWAQLVANPGHAPELLALAAVQTIGPRAAAWAARLRERYPHATDDGLARLAERQFIRFGGVGSVFAAAAGSYVPVALLSSNAVTYAELILHVAAAYNVDPTDRARAVDLLVLTQVHATPEDAEEALSAAEQPAYEEETRLTDAIWRLGRMASAQAAVWALVRGVNRLFPGVTVLSAIITSRSGGRTMAARATRYYSGLSRELGAH
ncbi:hypothetical protein [Actinoplanes sp. NBRC 103695]|uniref:hypothetical protein n=1 Tax=Actinoplanes sp. NBRC 103695 TaxID=3032202 RepID=UPI002555A238|nr:hypothetical protein [Actinoplanes sp. NBRC 103695]